MNLLAFDTCLDKTYVTLYNGKNFINKTIISDSENYHSAYLISTIVEILKENYLTPKDIECIATDIGPGSFTGIRACVTVARMLAQQLNIKAIGISSLEILSAVNNDNNVVVLDARKNKAYVYDKKNLGAIELEEVEKLVKEKSIIADDKMLERFAQYSKNAISYQQANYELGEILAMVSIEKLKNNDSITDWGHLKPLYIQPPPIFGK